jgi:hypothetical protein
VIYAAESRDFFLGLAAFFTAVASFITAWYAIRKAKRESKTEGEADCHEKLTAAYAESEALATELHELKMGMFQPDEPTEEVAVRNGDGAWVQFARVDRPHGVECGLGPGGSTGSARPSRYPGASRPSRPSGVAGHGRIDGHSRSSG